MNRIADIAILVREYDEAIAFYTDTLGFVLLEDTDLGNGKRWVRVALAGAVEPPKSRNADTSKSRNEESGGTALLLARAVTPEQAQRIGNQTGGRVFLFVHTDDFDLDYAALSAKGVVFIREPSDEAYGRVAVFLDLYGNKIDLIGKRLDK